MTNTAGMRIHVKGVVQGVGFRPFVYALASRYDLTGWVRNTSAGVDIEADGEPQALAAFAHSLAAEAPPLSHIESIEVSERPADGYVGFEIRHSTPVPGAFQPISPDVGVCPDCLRELFDPTDRRYRYPFINCTNCGPRFTIIKDVPYDRPATTMAPFALCPACSREYADPLDRRFHAQPVACPACGPTIWTATRSGVNTARGAEAITAVQRALQAGLVVAVKGLGGFHLACDATNETAVASLRARKLRVDKPFAVMMPDADEVSRHCEVNEAEIALLTSMARPIVILQERVSGSLAASCAPGQSTLGVMLPYTPLHYLLFASEQSHGWLFEALVMTSANLSEEPIAYQNEEALERLSGLADLFLLHDRDIHARCDDSVMRALPQPPSTASGNVYPVRRSRGYAPFPVPLPKGAPPLLAVGGELKNAFCLTREQHAFLSHHIGDLENFETLRSFESGIAHYERLFRVTPAVLAYDLHPDYLATRYALARAQAEGLPAVGVQHHHAHVASVMAEHGHQGDRPVIGVAFDGTGYGTDGAIWGGEFLVADYTHFERALHLAYVPLAGGDRAVKQPWRTALAWLAHSGLDWVADLPSVQAAEAATMEVMRRLLEAGQEARQPFAPRTSSMGRLFDAVASLAGVRQEVNYEGQAAIELEAHVTPDSLAAAAPYPFELTEGVFDAAPLIRATAADVRAGQPAMAIAARFHQGVAQLVLDGCRQLRRSYGVHEVALSGGVWQNMVLLRLVTSRLEAADFIVYVHQAVPANDGGLALGQSAIAAAQWEKS